MHVPSGCCQIATPKDTNSLTEAGFLASARSARLQLSATARDGLRTVQTLLGNIRGDLKTPEESAATSLAGSNRIACHQEKASSRDIDVGSSRPDKTPGQQP